jgi:O-antigen biosynthesis protein
VLADQPWPRVSIVIPTCLKDIKIVAKCFSGRTERTDHPDFEVMACTFLGQWPFGLLVWSNPYTWSGINNFGAKQATGDHLLFLNDDVEPLHSDWLKEMVRLSRIRSVGAVGATLKYPNGTIQHEGITLANSTEFGRQLFRFCTGSEPRIAQVADHNRECRAVTGACLLTRRDCFDAVGGFDEELMLVGNDTDYCLRLADRGYSTVIAAAVLIHYEGISRDGTSEIDDIERFWKRWRGRLPADDPFTNPNLNVHKDDWSVDREVVSKLTSHKTHLVARGENEGPSDALFARLSRHRRCPFPFGPNHSRHDLGKLNLRAPIKHLCRFCGVAERIQDIAWAQQ